MLATELQQKETWREYFSRLSEIQRSCNKVLQAYETLERGVQGVELSEIFFSDSWKKVLLGGLSGESFSENALGLFYQRLYGVSFDLPQLVANLKSGLELEKASKGLYGKVERTRFINLAQSICDCLDDILQQAGRSFELPAPNAEGIDAEDPLMGRKAAEEFLQKLLPFSPNSSEESFFIFSLNNISRRYMLQAYPWLEGESFEFIRKVFEISPIIEPESLEEYAIWGFEEGSVGASVLELINTIWDLTEVPEVQEYFGLQSERERYRERAYQAWERALPKGREAKEIASLLNSSEIETDEYLLSKKNPFKLWEEQKSTKGYLSFWYPHYNGGHRVNGSHYTLKGVTVSLPSPWYAREKGDKLIPFSNFIDYLSPALYLNLGFINESEWGAPIPREV